MKQRRRATVKACPNSFAIPPCNALCFRSLVAMSVRVRCFTEGVIGRQPIAGTCCGTGTHKLVDLDGSARVRRKMVMTRFDRDSLILHWILHTRHQDIGSRCSPG
jgi:hypothetical protein